MIEEDNNNSQHQHNTMIIEDMEVNEGGDIDELLEAKTKTEPKPFTISKMQDDETKTIIHNLIDDIQDSTQTKTVHNPIDDIISEDMRVIHPTKYSARRQEETTQTTLSSIV
uniref:Uncharacterized protein n=1 Tax=Cacopsylla melanoneura TaxID=428564 RepID=A0A8D8X7I7_9HEMI